MQFFLSKYYSIQKAGLPNPITPDSIEKIAQWDIPGIFTALTHERADATQKDALLTFRNFLSTRYDYTAESLNLWLDDYELQHGDLAAIAPSLAYVCLVGTQVAVFVRGDFEVWRIRPNVAPWRCERSNQLLFLPTEALDAWVIVLRNESIKPDRLSTEQLPFQYASKVFEGQTSSHRFEILMIENVIDTYVQKTIPIKNKNVGQRVWNIAKRLIDADLPCGAYMPLLEALTAHESMGETARLALKKCQEPSPPLPLPLQPKNRIGWYIAGGVGLSVMAWGGYQYFNKNNTIKGQEQTEKRATPVLEKVTPVSAPVVVSGQSIARAKADLSEAANLYKAKDYEGAYSLLVVHSASPVFDSLDMFRLGYVYFKRNQLDSALYWYEQSAAKGCSWGQCNLGWMHERGKGTPQDYQKAFEWYVKSAKQNNATALCALGLMYERGTGRPKDLRQAKQYYQRAASLGSREAAENLLRLPQ